MKLSRFFSAVLFAIVLLCLTGCAAKNENALGFYTCSQISLEGEFFDTDEIYPQGCTLELNKWGQAWLNIDGDDFYVRWSLEGEQLTLDVGGELSEGVLSDGVCTLFFKNSGLEQVFLREGARLPQKDDMVSSSEALTDQQLFWNGDWYGTWQINNAQGLWLEQNGQRFDCFARFDIEADSTGKMIFWDELQSYMQPIAQAELIISESETNKSAGVAVSTGGRFLNVPLEETQWSVDPYGYLYDSTFFIKDGHYKDADGSFDYTIVLRPWGRTWEDAEAQDPTSLPYFYYDWYLPALSAGESMPDSFSFSQGTVIRDSWQDREEDILE